MTYVGKILVIVIMAFSLIFLGISTMVFTTSKNWRTATEEQKKKVEGPHEKAATMLRRASPRPLRKSSTRPRAASTPWPKQLNDRIKTLEDENKRRQDQITAARGQVGIAADERQDGPRRSDARRKETMLLREQKSAVEKQANEFKLRQAELNDKIRELERMLETATKNNADLRDRVAKFSTLLRAEWPVHRHQPRSRARRAPLPVGRRGHCGSTRPIGAWRSRSAPTTASVIGHELYLYRGRCRVPNTWARVRSSRVEPDQAVGRVIGTTYQGKKIKEGDIVSSTIKPRF